MQCTFLLLGTHENKNMTYSSVSRDAADLISLVRGRMLPSVRLFHLRLNGKYMNIIQSHCYIEYTTKPYAMFKIPWSYIFLVKLYLKMLTFYLKSS